MTEYPDEHVRQMQRAMELEAARRRDVAFLLLLADAPAPPAARAAAVSPQPTTENPT